MNRLSSLIYDYSSLRCNYSFGGPFGIFPEEYIVLFRAEDTPKSRMVYPHWEFPPQGQDYCIVKRNHLVILDETSGLVTVSVHSFNASDRTVRIGILNPNDEEEIFRVPLEDVAVLQEYDVSRE